MKLTLKLKSPLFDQPSLRARLSRVVKTSALELETDIKQYIRSSTPAGRTYRRGAITRAESKNTKALNLKTFVTPAGKTRAITAYKFHRASAKTQPPAIDTGSLLGSIASRDLSETRSRVSVGKKYGAYLDDDLQRYFFRIRTRLFKPKFMDRVKDVLKG